MDIQQLKYFLAVSRTCNYTKAAEEFFISRQAMAQSVRQLETQLQTPLFVKHKSSIKLTPMGEIFAKEATRIIRQFDQFEQSMMRYASNQRGTLRIGVGAGILTHLTPELFAQFNNQYPNILLAVTEIDNQEMARHLKEGLVDICLIGTSLQFLKDYCATLILKNDLCICCHKDNPLSQKEVLTMEDLKGQPMVGHGDGYDMHRFYIQKCKEHGFEPTFSIISTDTQIAIRLVQRNRSISFGFSAFRYPSGMVDPNSPIRVLPLELNEPDEWGIYAITRRNEPQTILQKILIEYLLSAQE